MSYSEIDKRMKDKVSWYGTAADYWENVDPTVNGMLQGFETISDIDVNGSKEFLKNLKDEGILTAKFHKAADCGAGIGRVTKHFLLTQFEVVDIIEQCEKFTNNIHVYMDDEKLSSRIENIFTEGLQTFIPQEKHYDVIWIQWVVGHIADDDLVTFLTRCKKGLTDGGCIVIKDNISSGSTILDKEDSSVTRTDEELVSIANKMGLKVLKKETQKGFPSHIFKVNMYAFA